MKALWTFVLVALGILLCGMPGAEAHAFLDRATPAVGSSVHGSPDAVKLWFTEKLEPAFSTLSVVGPDGKTVDNGDKTVDSNDATLLEVTLPKLAPGTYKVVWRVLSVDNHVTEGDFKFDVVP